MENMKLRQATTQSGNTSARPPGPLEPSMGSTSPGALRRSRKAATYPAIGIPFCDFLRFSAKIS